MIEPLFQAKLGVEKGDIVVIRQDMLSKGVSALVADFWPIEDMGLNIVRVSEYAMEKIGVETNQTALIEKWEKIKGKEVEIQYFIHNWSFEQQLSETSQIIQYIDKNLAEQIKRELNSLPISSFDFFQTIMEIPLREEPLKIDFWVSNIHPQFPIVILEPKTIIKVKSRAKEIYRKKISSHRNI